MDLMNKVVKILARRPKGCCESHNVYKRIGVVVEEESYYDGSVYKVWTGDPESSDFWFDESELVLASGDEAVTKLVKLANERWTV